MKKIILIFILLSNFLWGLELTKLETNWLREHPVIRIAPDPDFPPIEWIDENGEYKGIAKDYIDIISGKLNIKFETVQCKNWEQVLKKAQNHEVDMLPAGAQTPQRAKYMNFSTPHIIFPGVFITGNEHADITSINELYGKKIVCVSGYVWQDMFNLHHPEIEIVSVPNLQTGLRKVAMGENDVLIATLPIALYYIEKEGISNLRVAGESGFFTKLSILTRKDWPLLGTIMEKAVLSIDAETKKKILNKWVKIDRPTIFVSRKFQNILIGIILLSGIIIIAIYSWNRALKKLVVKRAAEVENVMEKRLKVEQELVVAGKQWHQIIDSTEDAIWILDLDHRILQSNKAAEKLFHISHNKIINQFCYPLVHKTTEPIEDCPFLRMKKSLKKEAMEMQTDFGWHYITTDPLLDDKGRLIGAVHIVRDITERKKIEKLNKHNLEKKIIFYIASFILFAAIIVAILIIVGGEKNLISREQKQLLIVSKAIYKDYTTFFQDVTDVGLALNKSLKQQILSSDQIPDFEQKAETIVRSEDGAIRIDDGVSGAFVAKDTSLDADLLKDIINTQKTFEIISDVAKTHWFNLYFISKQNFIRIVPKDWALEIEADHSFNKDVFYQIADPEHNPERQPRWTPVYYDEIWKKWMTSLIIPIYDGEEFIGITGSDIFLDTLFEKVSILYAETSEYKAVIFDADGNILVHPESRNSILYQSGKMNTLLNMSDLNDPILNKLIPEIISAKFNFGMINTTDNMINNYYYYVNNIPSIDWYLCIYAAKSTLLKELNIYIIKILSFAIGLSIIVILIIRLYIKRFLLKRITNLNTAISKISSGDMDAKIEQKYNDEIGVLEKGFSEMQLSLIMKFAELREAEKDIQDSEERYQSYVNNAPDGIFIINEIGEFKFANQTAFVITGYKKTELLQMTVNDLLAEDSKREGKQHLDLVIKNSKATTELLYQTKSGETKHWSVSSVKLSEIRILCFAKDVTDRKLAELKLKDYYQNLEKAIKERTHELEESQTALIYMLEDVNETQEALKISNNQISEVNKDLESFAYSISHDLRAPLRSIIGFSEIVLKRHAANLNEEGKKYLNYVVEAGNHLANLIDDLLKYSRISKKPNNSVNMTNELRKVINKLKGDISAKDAKVILPKKLPILRSNVGLINQIFSNLILNGITYQNKGSKPIVEISVKAEEDNFIFMIQDNGIGIDEKYQEKIFDIFQRLHTQEDFPGSGIGLALVKKAVKKLGGSIRLNSKLGEGTTFIVALPK